jgi:hypothetical protein
LSLRPAAQEKLAEARARASEAKAEAEDRAKAAVKLLATEQAKSGQKNVDAECPGALVVKASAAVRERVVAEAAESAAPRRGAWRLRPQRRRLRGQRRRCRHRWRSSRPLRSDRRRRGENDGGRTDRRWGLHKQAMGAAQTGSRTSAITTNCATGCIQTSCSRPAPAVRGARSSQGLALQLRLLCNDLGLLALQLKPPPLSVDARFHLLDIHSQLGRVDLNKIK